VPVAQARERRQLSRQTGPTEKAAKARGGISTRRAWTCKHAVDRLYQELRVINESAAGSLAEGLEETLTLHRLNVFTELGVSFRSTNLIESVMARLEPKTHHVTRWRTSDQKLNA
jgi:hypothetical protein